MWHCTVCSTDVEDQYEVCWNCLHDRDGIKTEYSQQAIDNYEPDYSARNLDILMQDMTEYQKITFLKRYIFESKSESTGMLLAIFFGCFGIDRFYVDDFKIGFLKLMTLGLCGVLWILDLFVIMNRVKQFNETMAVKLAREIKTS